MNSVQTFYFKTLPVRVIFRSEEPWFVAADVCRILGITNHRDAVQKLDDDEKDCVGLTDAIGRDQETTIVSESGLYTLLLRCRDAVKVGTDAHRFRKWVTSEVLPSIRRDGFYEIPGKVTSPDTNLDGRAFGFPLAKVNSIASMMRAVQNAAGPEAALEIYRLSGMPQISHLTVGAIAGTSCDDPNGCIRHLLRASTRNGVSMANLLTMALHDAVAAKSLPDYGLKLGPQEASDCLAIANRHPFLARLYADTQWCGDWRVALTMLPGARASRGKVTFGKETERATLLPRVNLIAIINPY